MKGHINTALRECLSDHGVFRDALPFRLGDGYRDGGTRLDTPVIASTLAALTLTEGTPNTLDSATITNTTAFTDPAGANGITLAQANRCEHVVFGVGSGTTGVFWEFMVPFDASDSPFDTAGEEHGAHLQLLIDCKRDTATDAAALLQVSVSKQSASGEGAAAVSVVSNTDVVAPTGSDYELVTVDLGRLEDIQPGDLLSIRLRISAAHTTDTFRVRRIVPRYKANAALTDADLR